MLFLDLVSFPSLAVISGAAYLFGDELLSLENRGRPISQSRHGHNGLAFVRKALQKC
jgi:hypothetical protein